MRRLVVTGAVAAAALLAAAVLALLSHAVLATEPSFSRDAARIAAGVPPAADPSPGPAQRAAEAMLGVRDDREYRRAVGIVLESRFQGTDRDTVLALHAEARALLGSLGREGGSPGLRADASNLEGALLLEDANLDDRGRVRLLTLAYESFRSAALADPESEDAKRNLELAQALLARRRADAGGGSDGLGDSGAGANPAGEGF